MLTLDAAAPGQRLMGFRKIRVCAASGVLPQVCNEAGGEAGGDQDHLAPGESGYCLSQFSRSGLAALPVPAGEPRVQTFSGTCEACL